MIASVRIFPEAYSIVAPVGGPRASRVILTPVCFSSEEIYSTVPSPYIVFMAKGICFMAKSVYFVAAHAAQRQNQFDLWQNQFDLRLTQFDLWLIKFIFWLKNDA